MVPMTAPVTRFSLRMPVVPVMIIPMEAMATATLIPRSVLTITMLCLGNQGFLCLHLPLR